jgi:vacuolar-type H+-ATPase subunit I/STV1
MKKNESLVVLIAVIMVLVMLSPVAYAGKNPNGKPFLELQGQILEIEGEISTLQDQVDSIVVQVATIEEKIFANEQAIVSLQDQNAALQAQIDAHATDIASIQAEIAALEADNAALQAQIDANVGDIDSLQAQIATNSGLIDALTQNISEINVDLQDQIDNNLALIVAMEAEIQAINAILAEKQRIVSGSCPEGQSIRQINVDGSVVCEIDNSGAESAIESVAVGNFFVMPPSSYREVETFCPAGYTVTGGGFMAYPSGTIIGSLPDNNGWRIMIDNKTSSNAYSLINAQCIKIVAP